MTRTSAKHIFYPESSVGGFSDIDGTIAFYLRVNALLGSGHVALDVGCGRGEYAEDPVETRAQLRILRGKCVAVLGIDPDEAGAQNPFIDEFRLISSTTWPIDDESIDLCLVDNVLEHVRKPQPFFAECRRVVKAGGVLCVRTPNALGYATVMARLIPNRAHASVLRRVQEGREPQDVFPAHYRCNRPRQLRRMLSAHGFESCVYGHGSEPAYLDFSAFAYALGVAYGKVAPKDFQCTLFAFARKLY